MFKWVLVLSVSFLLLPTAKADDQLKEAIRPSSTETTDQKSAVAEHTPNAPQSGPAPKDKDEARPIVNIPNIDPTDIFACVDGLKKARMFPPTSELSLNGNRILFLDNHFVAKDGIFALDLQPVATDAFYLGLRDRFEVVLPKNLGSAEISGIDVRGDTRLVARAIDQREQPTRRIGVAWVQMPNPTAVGRDDSLPQILREIVKFFNQDLSRRFAMYEDLSERPNTAPEVKAEMNRIGYPDKLDAELFAWLAPCEKFNLVKQEIVRLRSEIKKQLAKKSE